jgi:hypothetical protein
VKKISKYNSLHQIKLIYTKSNLFFKKREVTQHRKDSDFKDEEEGEYKE